MNSTSLIPKESLAPKSNNLKTSLAFSILPALENRNKTPIRLRKLYSFDSISYIVSILKASKNKYKREFFSQERSYFKANYENAFLIF